MPAMTPALRLTAAAGLLGVAFTHMLDLPHKLAEAPYLAALFVGLITAATVLAIAVLSERFCRSGAVAAGGLSALALAGYVASRTVGLPQLRDHVGDWASPAGVASLGFEVALVVLAAAVLAERRAATAAAPARVGAPARLAA